ncbi:hypothetical protein [Achromobacter sp. Marseille-Q4962]|uniref:hypothetical protein n=1 Tax=Achromobacter sp. Marseille-Q4962 TaxID=2942202 RepID=UPI0020747E31|nr:hypothetical protein [Achromobacter sp. Marseille-Q4962]
MASISSSLGRSIAVSLVDLLDFLVAALVAMKTLHYESILARVSLFPTVLLIAYAIRTSQYCHRRVASRI